MCSLWCGDDESDQSPAKAVDAAVPLDVLEAQIAELAANIAAAMYRWLTLVAEFDARGGWVDGGFSSCAHWLSWRCGVGLTAAHEHVRVGRALGALPVLSRHFASGELSYSKARAITRVAQPETDAALVEIARHATGAQLDRLVQGYGGVIRASRQSAQTAVEKQHLTCQWDEDGMLRVQGRLTAEDGAKLLSALDGVEFNDGPVPIGERRAAALIELAEGEKRVVPELVVHVDAESLAAERISDRCEVGDGAAAIAPEVARRLGCDCSLRTIVERDGEPLSVGRRTRAINPALRRALQSRDDGCRFPGCTHRRFIDAHHVKHWVQGGETKLGNLIQLCGRHHRKVHEGGFTVTLDADGEPHFFSPHGWEVPPYGMVAQAVITPVEVGNAERGVVVDPDTCWPLSAGDPLDYDIAVEGLAGQWLPVSREAAIRGSG